ncbi:transmembrane emp24 domain-containing protein 5 isoform X4 [Hemitrygon akajei]|uniref:transmembrane emp24 domain-containing protein 5 isoform X4 n=1 Tax=Hemitrygon akajei TaxID=2704970 RepID=UPI003BF9CE2A
MAVFFSGRSCFPHITKTRYLTTDYVGNDGRTRGRLSDVLGSAAELAIVIGPTGRSDGSRSACVPVIDGAGLDVDFYISSPNGNILYFDQRKSDGVHSIETENGDYMFCFDNSFSSISEKETINSVKARLSKSNQIQGLLRAYEARDRNLQEGNYDRVNFWSIVNLAVMLIVSGLQELRRGQEGRWLKMLWEGASLLHKVLCADEWLQGGKTNTPERERPLVRAGC